jgi:hypothetical protein
VALTTLQYTNHFYQLREDLTIYVVVIVPDLRSVEIMAPLGKPRQLDVDIPGIHAFGAAKRRILRAFVDNDTNGSD